MRRVTKSLLALTGLGGAAAVGFFFKSRFFSRLLEKRTSDEVLFHGNTREKVIALTIDDGPHALLTADILDVLAAYAVPATRKRAVNGISSWACRATIASYSMSSTTQPSASSK